MPRTSRLDVPFRWYPWTPLDWKADRHFQRLSWAEKGFLRELMDECYLERAIPSEVGRIAHLMAADAQEVEEILPKVLGWFEPSTDGSLICPWIEAVRAEQDEARLRQANRRRGGGEVFPTTADNRGPVGKETTGHEVGGDERETSACAESGAPTSAPSDGTPLLLPCVGKGEKIWPITGRIWREWEQAFPGVDLLQEVLKMRSWLRANPRKQKTFAGMERFAYSWLSRAQDRPALIPKERSGKDGGFSRTPGLDADFLDQLKDVDGEDEEDQNHAR